MLLHDYESALRYGAKILPSEILGGGYTSFGDVYYVDATNGSDTNNGTSPTNAMATVAAAYALTTTNSDDVIVLSTNANHVLTSMLTVSKNRVHFVGDTWGRQYGPRAKVYMGITTATTDVFAVKNTGVGNTFTGIKFYNDNTLAQNVAAVGEGGEYAVYRNCEFYNSTNLTSDTVSEMVLNGDSAQFFNCTFGSLADAVSGNKVRPAVLLTKGTVGTGLVSRDVLFDGCRFWKQAGGVTTSFVKGGATDVERVMEFHDCQFIANPLGSAPATAITSATLTVGIILLSGDTAAVGCTALATATGVFAALNAKVAATHIALQSTN